VAAEAIRVELDAGCRDEVVGHWTRHRIADMVRLAPNDGLAVVAVVGPRSGALLDPLCGESVSELAPLDWVTASIAGVPVRVRRNDERLDIVGWDVTVDSDAAPTVIAALAAAGAVEVTDAAWTAVRVANGVPIDRIDMNEENIPLESDHLIRAISWDKGCYIGQEVIARMHYRGKPNRHLRGVRLSAGEAPSPGDILVAEGGKEVGVVGTVCERSETGDAIALAVVKRHFADPGTPLTTPGGTRAIVVSLPFGTAAD
ncbi:MAG: hypothetical protein QF464_23775, partial [Myxococcota bacterium]|nr:hypothetical protein [Myxococcota bacterium]